MTKCNLYATQKNQLGSAGYGSMVTGSVVVAWAQLLSSSSSSRLVKEGALASLYIRHLSMQVDQDLIFMFNKTRDSLSLNCN